MNSDQVFRVRFALVGDRGEDVIYVQAVDAEEASDWTARGLLCERVLSVARVGQLEKAINPYFKVSDPDRRAA